VRRAVRVTGVVQGVGFRPFVHGLASRLGLVGLVGNDAAGVFVEVEGPAYAVDDFLAQLVTDAPSLAAVESAEVTEIATLGESGFVIVESRADAEGATTLIPPDTAVCDACLTEVHDPADRRHRYPFTACTYCGPRYTLVTGLPYDRPFTTMAAFPLCPACAAEYADPSDRRFHAQPTACPVCGPRLAFRRTTDDGVTSWSDDALADALRVLHEGGVIAVKGVGGYHLACDAYRPDAVAALRGRKQRGAKPFAVMVPDADAAASLVAVDADARAALESPSAPIVVLPVLASLEQNGAEAGLVEAAAPGVGTLGLLLPYSPLHHLLFAAHPSLPDVAPPRALVMTSGNISDEPLCIDADEADTRLAALADAFLHHDRPIHVACDDSVVRRVGAHLQPVRRSRGFAPLPVRLPLDAVPSLAVGGELKTAICLASGRRACMSQHVGDTENLETLAMLERTARTLGELTRVVPELVVADAHPAYLSRRWATQWASERGLDTVLVQHHHAHVASLLAEHGVHPDERVLGVAFDGTGYGGDGTIWGGELLLGSYASVERVGHLLPVPLPGGDAAVRRPARTALAHLHAAGVAWDADLPSVQAASGVELTALAGMLRGGAGCVPTTSMGRLFDAVASMLDVRHDIDHEGQAAMELEGLAADHGDPSWSFGIDDPGGSVELDAGPVVRAACASVRDGVPAAEAAYRFHEAVAEAVERSALLVRERHGVGVVGLTGGVFQNARLTVACQGRLERHGFTVLVHRLVPPNDGGLALGQVAVAAAGGGAWARDARTRGTGSPGSSSTVTAQGSRRGEG
jgi:hydrogenase maturation protein HypF